MFVKKLFITVPARKNTAEVKLYVHIVAEDEKNLDTKPYIFMLPGGPGANHSHYKAYECLKKIANVVFFDPRGCGLSEKSEPATYTMDNYIQDVEEIRRQLKQEKIIVLGKSYGAMSALGYTLENPQHVSKLILAAGSPSYKNLVTAKENVLSRGTEEQKKVCETLWAGTFSSDDEVDDFFDVMDTMYSWKKRQGQAISDSAPDYPFAHQPLNQGFGGFLRTFDYEERLAEVACDTLILVGEEDWITDKKHSQLMARKIPQNQFIVFPHSDHSMETDVPEAFFASIEEFIKNKPEKKQHRFFQPESDEKKSTTINNWQENNVSFS